MRFFMIAFAKTERRRKNFSSRDAAMYGLYCFYDALCLVCRVVFAKTVVL
jgi:hypothetical protein